MSSKISQIALQLLICLLSSSTFGQLFPVVNLAIEDLRRNNEE
jgi:hypothetical protein